MTHIFINPDTDTLYVDGAPVVWHASAEHPLSTHLGLRLDWQKTRELAHVEAVFGMPFWRGWQALHSLLGPSA